jgi:hypothetical protein
MCEGNLSEAQKKISLSGCLYDELYREVLYAGSYGLNEKEIEYVVPENVTTALDFSVNYSIFVCDGYACSDGMDNSYFKKELRNITQVEVVNQSNGRSFTNSFAEDSDNLQCNFSFVGLDGLTYTQENLTQLQDRLELNWYKNTSLNEYVPTNYTNMPSMSNLQTRVGERWMCQIRFTDATNPQETNSTPIIVRDYEAELNSAPTIEQYYVSKTFGLVNEGEPFSFEILWEDQDGDPVYAYVCDSNVIGATGCYGNTLAYTTQFTYDNLINNLEYTFEDFSGSQIQTFARVCDTTYNCSNIENFTLTINNIPDLENVSVSRVENENSYECSYDFISNDPTNDHNSSGTEYRWYISNNGVLSTVSNGFGPSYKVFSPGLESQGIIYCEARVVDNKGLVSPEFVRSDNFLTISNDEYEIEVKDVEDLTNASSVNFIGLLKSVTDSAVNGVNITAYVFNQSYFDLSPMNRSTLTYAYENDPIGNAELVNDSSSNKTLVYLEKSTENIALLNRSVEKYIGFYDSTLGEHVLRSNYNYYNYSVILTNPDYLVLSLDEPLEKSVKRNDLVYIYSYPIMTGFFNVSAPL